MENMENLLNIYNQLRSCTNSDKVEELKRNFKGSFHIEKREKKSDQDSHKNGGNEVLGIWNRGKSRMISVAETSREVDNLMKEAKELAEIGRFGDDLAIEVQEERQVQFPTNILMGENFASHIHEITHLLTKNKAWTIGVWGMGGVGKTTLIKHLHNMMLDEPQIYGFVYWITVSKDCSIQKLQNDIAKRIGESIPDKLDESQRAGILVEALERKKKFVFILDDMWLDYDLNEVGLGIPKKIGYQLIITSRSEEVCLKMYCDNIFKMVCLSDKDAWALFVRSIGREIPDDLKRISIDVLQECAGLPLGIITLAKSMIGCNDVCEWMNVLGELRNSSGKVDDMEEKVFNVLRLSYDRLKDWKIKECLLYCATYPEDYQIEINELIWLFIDARLLGKNVGITKMFDKGLAILRKLERVALLSIEIVSFLEKKECVRLHDLIRDMALQIAGSRFMIKADLGLKGIPDGRSWTDHLEVVSLMEIQAEEIFDLLPKCNQLSTLLLKRNYSPSLSDGFFKYLHKLKHLNLSFSYIRTLPKSITLLKNLTALILRCCLILQNVPSLAELTSLERLDLFRTSISLLPEGIGSLIKLRYLNLYYTKIERIGVGIISKLTALQYLAMEARIDVNELNSLNNLEHLTVLFEDFVSFSTYIQQMKIKGRPNFYMFFVGNFNSKYTYPFEVAGRIWRLKQIYLRKTKINQYDRLDRIIFGKDSFGYSIVDDIRVLDIYDDKDAKSLGDYVFDCACNVQRQSQMERGSKPFSNLKCLKFRNCLNLKRLFPLGLLSNLQNIEEIDIRSCEGLEELIEEACDENKLVGVANPKTFPLPKLEYIHLENLPNLKRLCRDDKVIHVPLLNITIKRCRKLKRMPLDVDKISLFPRMDYCFGEKKWVDSLEWDPPESKLRFFFYCI